MSTTNVSDMLVTVKSREVQRAMLAQMKGDQADASKHFLAAAHLELVLADDYVAAGQSQLSRRSRLSAGSCLWRAGRVDQARDLFDAVNLEEPDSAGEVRQLIDELTADHPSMAS